MIGSRVSELVGRVREGVFGWGGLLWPVTHAAEYVLTTRAEHFTCQSLRPRHEQQQLSIDLALIGVNRLPTRHILAAI